MALQIKNATNCQVSSDISSTPQQLLFSEISSYTDTTTLSQVESASNSYPVATTVISMGQVSSAKFLFIKAASGAGAVSYTINGGSPVALVAGFPSIMWQTMTSLSITVSGSPTQVQIFFAG